MKFFVLFCLALVAPEVYSGSGGVGPCGVFVPYNPKVNPMLPERDGLSAGTYLDGTQAYVGSGNTGGCNNQPYLPGRISTADTYSGPGVYMSCGGRYQYDGVTPSYFQASSRAAWVATNFAQAPAIPGLVKVKSERYLFAIARITVDLFNGTKYTEVSKAHINAGAFGMWYMTPSGERSAFASFEVLVCM